MTDTFKIKILYGASFAFIALNVLFIANEIYWFMALPLALLVMLLFFFSLDKLLLAIVFITPFTFKYRHEAMGFTVDIPTEPVIVAIMCLFFLKLFYEQRYDMRIIRHPVTVILIINLIWMFVTSVTSEIPVVSFKFFISRLWFVVTFYFVLIQLFKQPEKIRLFLWLFGTALVMIIIYITIQHGGYGFERQVGTWVVRPFFNDHTNYSAVIALVAPVFIIKAFLKDYNVLSKRIALLFFAVFVMGIIFSYSRASWLSLFVAFGAFWILVLKIDYKLIFAGLILIVGTAYLFQDDIIMQLERNRQESSGDFREHAQSVTNITSDASNLERINRWRAAIRMFEERPILGWGPGTYQLVYAPFQLSEDHTIITTNFGDLGNAHSEYLGPLSESGIPGMLTFILLAVWVLITGVQNFKRAPTREFRWLSLGLTLGFITYFTHGLLNNFLDTDKASVPFWGFMAILVAIDIYHTPRREKKSKDLPES
ncbi:MAG: O-antigen ligase family protein [Bacteroidetes bacterium]|nr:MAG: O-antigen ligase family protein [Bacteroidota bacterium]